MTPRRYFSTELRLKYTNDYLYIIEKSMPYFFMCVDVVVFSHRQCAKVYSENFLSSGTLLSYSQDFGNLSFDTVM